MYMNKRKICVYLQTWESGGIEAFISNTLHHMNLDKMNVDIVVDVMRKSVFTDALQSRGVRFIELSGSQHNIIQNYRLFKRIIRFRQYDVIHLNLFQAVPLVYLSLAKRYGVSVRIAHSHNTDLRKSFFRGLKLHIHNAAKQLFTRDATQLWACSNNAAQFMFSPEMLNARGYQFIPNGIDMKRFRFNSEKRAQVRARLKLENTFVIGHIGRLCYQKNQELLLDVFHIVHQQLPQARLLLVGEGENEEHLKEKACALHIDKSVIFYGTTKAPEELLWSMDVFAFPSRFEGLGIVMVEAQAANLPVVYSANIPSEAVISDAEFTHLEPSYDASKWADAIIKFSKLERNILRPLDNRYDIAQSSQYISREYLQD